ncbi:MAG: tRNA(fMet)-specific endonuclease VapC [Acidobacteriota bacterium]|nr:tRNA(fMet)-specific endonuclease VapC [Acidobacteriota bacterium]
MRVLLDTNAYSALRRGNEIVADHVRRSEEVLLSAVVVGELLFGFRNGSRYEENAHALQIFLKDPNVRLLPVTWDAADLFGQISTALRRRGKPIPTNDIWIAAHAMEESADLLSSDDHFSEIDGLSWVHFSAR